METVLEGGSDNDDQTPEGQWPEGEGLAKDLANDVQDCLGLAKDIANDAQVDLSTRLSRLSSTPTTTNAVHNSGLQSLSTRPTNAPTETDACDSGLQDLVIDTNDPGRADFVISVGALGNASGAPLDGSQNMSFGERRVDEQRAIDGNNNNANNNNEGMLVHSRSESSMSYNAPSGFDPHDPEVIAGLMT